MSQSINLYKQLANHKLFNKSVNFGLKRIKLALALLGHPEKKLKNVISVVGESGKFTTLFSLKSFIEASNQNVTTHISPSLRDIRERFYMGEKYLSHKEIKKTIKQIEKLNIPLTIFECLTLVYIINASKINVDYNIQETGALWRLDSNNIHDFPKIQICTNINKQHLNFLKRKTLDEVIKEDVGFLSDFTNIYIGKQSPNVLRKIKTHLRNNKSIIIYPNAWKLTKKGVQYYYQDRKYKIKLNTKNVYSKGMFENVCLAIKVALDLKIDKKTIQKTLPLLSFEGRFQYLNKGKIKNRLHKNEIIMIDGAHATADAQNLAAYLKNIKIPKYGIWAMTKNKEPDLFIKKLKGVFKKIVIMPIENETNSVSVNKLYKIAVKNKFKVEKSNNFTEALKKISSKEKKLIVCFGSLYNCGNILNKN
jgi:dihydrofolate synthase/folylpolyglutamate synthase